MSAWIAALIALFVWWFSTGAILFAVKYADRAGVKARMRTTFLGLPLLIVGAIGITWSFADPTLFGVYVGFLSALAIWGWIELAFLTGAITGPNHKPLRDNVTEGERFLSAWGTVAYHEILLVTALALVLWTGLGQANTFGVWTFVILYFARISAKLNLYLGVPKIQIDFLPNVLSHLPSHFRSKPMNWLFPVSITALSFAAGCWLERLYSAQTEAQIEGFALLTALTVLALFEHWMMVLPIPDERLWRWALPASKQQHHKTEPGGSHGL
jgi:putative photosynthetic complex assembly protein 2